ncbi:ABC transporter substrate-binding protein [Planomonospora alba]|uniref:ABC transporter substrate-binding protein n=1 Tax=Planomonospora alba TaxID=161354 RepID=A0ABP6N0F6_9ACTN
MTAGHDGPPRPRRSRIAWIGFCAGCLTVVALGVAPYPAPSGGAPPCATDHELTIATSSDVSSGSFRRDVVDEWNRRAGTTMKAKLVEISDSTDEERAEMAAAAQSQDCAYDILILDVAWTAEFARNGHLRPLSPGSGPGVPFLEKALTTTEVDGVRYAVPFATNAPLLFRREGLPAPGTPGELLRLAAEHGYAGQLADYEGGTVNLLEMVLSGGAEVLDGDEVVLDRPDDAREAGEALAAWQAALSRRTGADALSLKEESSLQAFRSRQAGYLRNWPFAFHRLASDPAMRDGDGLRFAVGPLPGTGVLGGSNLAVTSRSPDAAEAERLIAFLTTPQTQKKLFACGGYPPVVESVYDDYRVRPRTCGELLAEGDPEAGRPDPDGEITAGQLRLFADAVRLAVRRAWPRPPAVHYSTFSEVFRSCARQVVDGALDAGELDFPRFSGALREALDGRRPEHDPCRRPTGR